MALPVTYAVTVEDERLAAINTLASCHAPTITPLITCAEGTRPLALDGRDQTVTAKAGAKATSLTALGRAGPASTTVPIRKGVLDVCNVACHPTDGEKWMPGMADDVQGAGVGVIHTAGKRFRLMGAARPSCEPLFS